MHAVRLDDNVNRGVTAGSHQQISEVDPHVMHAAGQGKIVRSPRALRCLAVDDDGRRAEIEKERQRKEACLDLNSGPGCLCGHNQLIRSC